MRDYARLCEIMREAQNLKPDERKELLKFLVDGLFESKSEAKTGVEIAAILATMPAIEFVDEDIIDPVKWVKAQRRKEAQRLNWGAE